MTNSSRSLTGKVALVTGASRGIGRATAIRLAQSGATVAINFVTNETAARQTAESVMSAGGDALLVKADVSEEEDVKQMLGYVGERYGRIDIVVSNAASGGFRTVEKANSRHFDAAMHTNVRALLWLVQSSLAWFGKSSGNQKVIALSSHGSHRALPNYALIGASKAALESLIRHMALELGPKGINFNCVLAGLVATDSTSGFEGAAEIHAEANRRMLIGNERTLNPEDVAEVVHFLATPASDLIQGQTIVIDGGASLTV